MALPDAWLLLATGAVATAGGVGVLVAGNERAQNRVLAAWFGVVALVNVSWGVRGLAADPFLALNAAVYNLAAWNMLPVYLLFVGLAVDSPLTRPLRLRLVRSGLWWLVGVGALAPFVALWSTPPEARMDFRWWIPPEVYQGLTVLFATFALVAAFDAWRRAPRASLARERARAYLWAFGVADVGSALMVGSRLAPDAWRLKWLDTVETGFLVVALWTALLARAMLRHQLFDFDLKVKWAIRRTTLAGAFVAAFFVVSEASSQLLGDATGSAYWGIAATGALVFALAPLQRLADRVADTAMPRVREDDAEYVRLRKADVYRAALEGALVDGEVTTRERAMLTRLQLELGISNAEVREMERSAAEDARAQASEAGA